MSKFILHYSNNPPFSPTDHETKGLGGTENFAVYIAKNLAQQGHEVKFYNQLAIEPTNIEGIHWANLSYFNPSEPCDFLISFRMREVFQQTLAARKKILILADTESVGLGDDVRAGRINIVMPVGKWQMEKIAQEEGLTGHPCWMLASNGIDMQEFVDSSTSEKQTGMCIHLSTPERGLGPLLDIWPLVASSKVLQNRNIAPELHLFSSFKGWGVTDEENENMCKDLYARIEQLQSEGYMVANHRHAARPVLRMWQMSADLLLYPTNFKETYCISLTECMAAGVIPVVSNKAALGERILDGLNGWLVGNADTDINTEEAKQEFAQRVITALWLSSVVKNQMRKKAIETAARHDYSKLVGDWVHEWNARL